MTITVINMRIMDTGKATVPRSAWRWLPVPVLGFVVL
jgi:hypothetical protein